MKKINLQSASLILIDDGGVMNDNNARSHQWKELIADYFIPIYGGSRSRWKEANQYALNNLLSRYNKTITENPLVDFNSYWKLEMTHWIKDMFRIVNIDLPSEKKLFKLAKNAGEWITPRVRAAYPGVAKTIETLSDKGFQLCTASGEVSWELNGYLTGMMIVEFFTKLYGPDLINTAKASTVFFNKILQERTVNPKNAILIDDSLWQLELASSVGIGTIHVLNDKSCNSTNCDVHINSLKELTNLI